MSSSTFVSVKIASESASIAPQAAGRYSVHANLLARAKFFSRCTNPVHGYTLQSH